MAELCLIVQRDGAPSLTMAVHEGGRLASVVNVKDKARRWKPVLTSLSLTKLGCPRSPSRDFHDVFSPVCPFDSHDEK
jgi:hypothetical protein